MTDELFLWKKNEDKWYEFLLWVELSFYLRVHVKYVKAIFTCFTINLKINLKETSLISQFLFEIFFFLNVVNSAVREANLNFLNEILRARCTCCLAAIEAFSATINEK